jgi:hypothetical protein
MNKFEVGKTYATCSPVDADHVVWAEIVRRTDKSAVIKTLTNSEGKRVKIYVTHDGKDEYLMPWGRFSMAPCISADRVQA